MSEMESRYKRDWLTNPTFKEFSARMQEMHRKEVESLKAASRGESITKVNHQQGILDGIERTIALIEEMQREVFGNN